MTELSGSAAEFLPRIVDPTRVEVVDLGPCRCPGRPHETDSALVRAELGAGERESIAQAGWGRSHGPYFDWNASNSEAIAVAVTAWTLVGPAGEDGVRVPYPVTYEVAHRLDAATRKTLLAKIEELNDATLKAEAALLPNASGGQSRNSSRETASPTRRTRQSR